MTSANLAQTFESQRQVYRVSKQFCSGDLVFVHKMELWVWGIDSKTIAYYIHRNTKQLIKQLPHV